MPRRRRKSPAVVARSSCGTPPSLRSTLSHLSAAGYADAECYANRFLIKSTTLIARPCDDSINAIERLAGEAGDAAGQRRRVRVGRPRQYGRSWPGVVSPVALGRADVVAQTRKGSALGCGPP